MYVAVSCAVAKNTDACATVFRVAPVIAPTWGSSMTQVSVLSLVTSWVVPSEK